MFAVTTLRFAVDGSLDVLARRVDPAHDLDEDVDRFVAEHDVGFRREKRPVELRHAILVGIAHEDAHDLEGRTDALRQVRRVRAKKLDDAATHGAAAEQAEPNRIHRAAVYTAADPRLLAI